MLKPSILLASLIASELVAAGSACAEVDANHVSYVRVPQYGSAVFYEFSQKPDRTKRFVPFIPKRKTCVDSFGLTSTTLREIREVDGCTMVTSRLEDPIADLRREKIPAPAPQVYCPGKAFRAGKLRLEVVGVLPTCLQVTESGKQLYELLSTMSPLVVFRDERGRELVSTVADLEELHAAWKTNSVTAWGTCGTQGLFAARADECAKARALENVLQACLGMGGRANPSTRRLVEPVSTGSVGGDLRRNTFSARATMQCRF